ncbi:ABC transporter permease [archaeon]|nr:MAG: ABC transporter permease [archaeon]
MQLERKAILRWVLDHLVWVLLFVVTLFLSFTIKGFAQWGIYRNILYHSVFVGILAIGEALVITTREMDLSVESVAGLAAIMTAWLTGTGLDASGILLNGYLTLIAVLAMGAVIGLFNATLIVKLKISSFIVTLAGYLIFRALGLVVTSGHGVIRLLPEVIAVARIKIFDLPLMVLVMIFVYAIFYVFLTRTRFGQHIYLVGDNREAAFNAGIRVDRVLFGVFMFSGMLAGLTGWLLAARTNGAAPSIGMGMLFEAFAAVVIGGVSLRGGVGNLLGVLAGAILLSAIATAVSILGMPPFYMNVIRGGFILIAVLLDAIVQRIRPYLL